MNNYLAVEYARLCDEHNNLMKEYGKLVGRHAAAVQLREDAEKRVTELEEELAAALVKVAELEATHEAC